MSRTQICSVSPEGFPPIERFTYNCTVRIPPANGSGYSSVWIDDHYDTERYYQDLDPKHTRYVPVEIKAEQIIRDIFTTEGLEERGVFVPKDQTPTEEEISLAKSKRREWLLRCAEEGDKLYSQFGDRGIQHIPDFCKRAVRELHIKRGWALMASAAEAQCPGCGTDVQSLPNGSLPAICANCKAPINKELAIELGLWTPPTQNATPVQKRKYTRKVKSETEVTA
jgi:hypothetical protein